MPALCFEGCEKLFAWVYEARLTRAVERRTVVKRLRCLLRRRRSVQRSRNALRIKAAVEGAPDGHGHWKVAPCSSLSDFRDQYLTDTAVTCMALAESTMPESFRSPPHC